jgi:hypothetical protein
MTSTTHTTAGLLAHAGAARLDGHADLGAAAAAARGLSTTQGAYGHHTSASWTVGAIAKPATFMVFNRKNRPTRPLPELSP